MPKNKTSIICILLLIALVTTAFWGIAEANTIDQKSVVSGKIIKSIDVGTSVTEGTVLIVVETITGPMPAARATADGVIKEVLVNIGDKVKPGDTVAKITTK